LPDLVFIEGIKFHGYHGLTRQERQIGVRLSVDVTLEVDSPGRARAIAWPTP
jgi:dihydroneopterin aldolase